eukprot:ANDGO_04287.mRNA.1 PBS lyase HEAT domain protein
MSQFTLDFLEQLEHDAQALYERFSVGTPLPSDVSNSTSRSILEEFPHLNVKNKPLSSIPTAAAAANDENLRISHLDHQHHSSSSSSASASVSLSLQRKLTPAEQLLAVRSSPSSSSEAIVEKAMHVERSASSNADAKIASFYEKTVLSRQASSAQKSHSQLSYGTRNPDELPLMETPMTNADQQLGSQDVDSNNQSMLDATLSSPIRISQSLNSIVKKHADAGSSRVALGTVLKSGSPSPNKKSSPSKKLSPDKNASPVKRGSPPPPSDASLDRSSLDASTRLVDSAHLVDDIFRDLESSVRKAPFSRPTQTMTAAEFPPPPKLDAFVSNLDVIPPPPELPLASRDEQAIFFLDYLRHKRHDVRLGAAEGLLRTMHAAHARGIACYSQKTYSTILRGISELFDIYIHQDAYCIALIFDCCNILGPVWKSILSPEEVMGIFVPTVLRILQDSLDAANTIANFVAPFATYSLFRLGKLGVHVLYEFLAKNPFADAILQLLANHPVAIDKIVLPRIVHDLVHEPLLFEVVTRVIPYFMDRFRDYSKDVASFFEGPGQNMQTQDRNILAHVLRVCGDGPAEKWLIDWATGHKSHRTRAACAHALSFPRIFIPSSAFQAKQLPFGVTRVGIDHHSRVRHMQFQTMGASALDGSAPRISQLLRYPSGEADALPDLFEVLAPSVVDPSGLLGLSDEMPIQPSLESIAFPKNVVQIDSRDLLHEIRNMIWNDPAWDHFPVVMLASSAFLSLPSSDAIQSPQSSICPPGVSSNSVFSHMAPTTDVVAALISGLSDAESLVRIASARGLGRLDAKSGVPAIKYLLSSAERDSDPTVREECLLAIPRLLVASGNLQGVLESTRMLCGIIRSDAFFKVRHSALRAVSQIGVLFASPRFYFRQQASGLDDRLWKSIDRECLHVIEVLLRVLRDGSLNRSEVAGAIVSMGKHGLDVLMGITGYSTSKESPAVRCAAVCALGGTLNICTRKTVEPRLVWTLEHAPSLLTLVVERVMHCISDALPQVRKSALEALLTLQITTQTCIFPLLLPTVGGEHGLALSAFAAFELVTAEALLPVFYSMLKDADRGVRTEAAECLSKCAPQGELLLVEALLKDQNPLVRLTSIVGLEKLGPRSSRALLLSLEDHDDSVWGASQKVLSSWLKSPDQWIQSVKQVGGPFEVAIVKTLQHVLTPGTLSDHVLPAQLRSALLHALSILHG